MNSPESQDAKSTWIPLAAGLGAGIVGALLVGWIGGQGPGADPSQVTAPRAAEQREIEELREALQKERQERESLAFDVAALRAVLLDEYGVDATELYEEIEDSRSASDRDGGDASADARERGDGETPLVGDEGAGHAGRVDTRPGFNDQSLLDLGLSDPEVAEIREHWERYQLAKLYLNDKARRGGWRGTPRFKQQQGKLRGSLRADLGDESYDALLYATGSNNRVVVGDVLGDSPAGDAGFAAGDVIVSYDSTRVFRASELSGATASGEPGERVRVEVMREGSSVSLYVPRGPLGVLLKSSSQSPGLN